MCNPSQNPVEKGKTPPHFSEVKVTIRLLQNYFYIKSFKLILSTRHLKCCQLYLQICFTTPCRDNSVASHSIVPSRSRKHGRLSNAIFCFCRRTVRQLPMSAHELYLLNHSMEHGYSAAHCLFFEKDKTLKCIALVQKLTGLVNI